MDNLLFKLDWLLPRVFQLFSFLVSFKICFVVFGSGFHYVLLEGLFNANLRGLEVSSSSLGVLPRTSKARSPNAP